MPLEVQLTISILQLKKTHFGVVMSHDDIIPGTLAKLGGVTGIRDRNNLQMAINL